MFLITKTKNGTQGAKTVKKVWNITKKAFPFVIWGLFIAVLLLTLWLAFDKYILKAPVPSVFGYATLTIETGSMNGTSVMVEGDEPVQVSIGDLILIKKTNDYKIGDVITFLHSGEQIPTTHRIIGLTNDGFITKGDANNTKDILPVSKDEVIGEVVGHYPKLGKFASWVKDEGWIYIAGALAILAIGSLLIKITSDDDEPEAESVEKEDKKEENGEKEHGKDETFKEENNEKEPLNGESEEISSSTENGEE